MAKNTNLQREAHHASRQSSALKRAREAVNDIGSGVFRGPFRTKALGEAVVELQAARAELRSIITQEATTRPKLTMLKPAVAMLGQTQRSPWQKQATTPKRISGRPLQRLRAELFQREPLCRNCKRNGRTTVATIRDHIVNLAEGGSEDPDNIQPLCQDCSDAKTAAEALRGRGHDNPPKQRVTIGPDGWPQT